MIERSGERWPDVSGPGASQPQQVARYTVSDKIWRDLTPGQKQASLLSDALDYKRELMAKTAEFEVSLENAPLHNLFLKCSDSIINQVLQIEANALHRPVSDEIEKLFEERQKHALREIERLSRGRDWHKAGGG